MTEFQPLYKQVYNLLVGRIADGAWRPAEALPSEQELARELGVSQGTVRKAMDALAADNLILRLQGKGSYVAEHTQEHALFRFFRLAHPAPHGGRVTPEPGRVRVQLRPATRSERARLQLDNNAEVVEIRRLRLVEGAPRISEKITLPQQLFPGIERQNTLPNTLYSLYQGEFGISIAVAREELSAVTATAQESRDLGLPRGAPLLQIDRVAVSLDGRVVEWRISRCDTKDLVYAVEIH
jgi:GntR family transcriptional regulator